MNALIKSKNNNQYQYPSLINSFFGKDLMDEFFTPTFNGTAPAVNIREDQDGYYIEVAAPGMQKSDFKLNLDHNRLTISAEHREENEFDNYEDQNGNTEKQEGDKRNKSEQSQRPAAKKGRYTRREFSYSSFQRTFTLPTTVDGEKIGATYTDGVLEVTLPKREEAKVKPSRTIEIA